MGKYGAGLGVDELNFLQNRLGLGAGFNPDQFKQAAPGQPGVSTPEDEAALRAQLMQQFGADSAGADTNQAGIQDIINRLLGVQTATANQPNLATLDAGAQGALDSIAAANKGALNLQQEQQRNDLLQNLFGSGTAQSTIALDQGGRLNFGQGQLQAQLMADAAQRELGLRNAVSDRALQSLGLQTNTLGTAGGLQVNRGQLGNQNMALRSSLLDSALNRGFNRDIANAGFAENAINRGFNQDQFRQTLLSNLGGQTATMQAGRQNPWGTALNAGLSLASSVIPLFTGGVGIPGIPKKKSGGSSLGIYGGDN